MIRRTLAKDRRRRYQSLDDVLVDTNPILALLQRGQTVGLMTEAQFYRSSGQLVAARQTSRRALEIDPSNFGAQQLLKAIQHEIQAECLAAPEEQPVAVVAVPPPPPAPLPFVPPPPPVAADPSRPIETPATPRLRPAMASGAAAAIAAAVAAAKARQAEEERQHQQRETKPQEETETHAARATPLIVAAMQQTRLVPAPQPAAASLKRAETTNGSQVFVTDDPLVVKRPATTVFTQRMNALDSTAAVATPEPAPPFAPPTRLPGTKAIPPSFPRNGKADASAPASSTAVNDSRKMSENLPMRRPPAEVYSKRRRHRSSSISINAEREWPKNFPWAIVLFVIAVMLAAGALVMFSLSAPKLVNTPVLKPDKMAFSWKPGTPLPNEQMLTLKGGSATASFTASSSDEEWLIVTPDSDEATNRKWRVKVDPDKVGSPGPLATTGWIDVSSPDGFKTQEEVTIRIGAAEVLPSNPTAPKTKSVTRTPTRLTPASTAKKAPAAVSLLNNAKPAASATVDSASTTTTKAPAPVTKAPATKSAPPVKKQPAADVN